MFCIFDRASGQKRGSPGVDRKISNQNRCFPPLHLFCSVVRHLSRARFYMLHFAPPVPGDGDQPSGTCTDGTRADKWRVLEKLPPTHLHRAPAAATTDHGRPLPHEGEPFRSAMRTYRLLHVYPRLVWHLCVLCCYSVCIRSAPRACHVVRIRAV